MLKGITLLLSIACSFTYSSLAFSSEDYMRVAARGSGVSEQAAIEHAYTQMMEEVLQNMLGDQVANGFEAAEILNELSSIGLDEYSKRYFRDDYYQPCQITGPRVQCVVKATAKLIQIRPRVSELRDRLDNVSKKIIVRYKNDESGGELEFSLASKLVSALASFSHKVTLLPYSIDDAYLGQVDNQCAYYTESLEKYTNASSSGPFFQALIKGMKTCELYWKSDYVFSFESAFNEGEFDSSYNLIDGEINIKGSLFPVGEVGTPFALNRQTFTYKGLGTTKNLARASLVEELGNRTVRNVTRQINEYLGRAVSKPGRDELKTTLGEDASIIVLRANYLERDKRKFVTSFVLEEYLFDAVRDETLSSDNVQIYLFNADGDMKLEDKLYDRAEAMGISLNVHVDRFGRYILTFES